MKVYLEIEKKVYENIGNWERNNENWEMVEKKTKKKKAVCKTARRAHSQKNTIHYLKPKESLGLS